MVVQKVVAHSSPDQTKGTNFIMTVWSFLFVQINGCATPFCSVDPTVQHQLSVTVWTLPRHAYNFTTRLSISQTLASNMWHPTAWPLRRKSADSSRPEWDDVVLNVPPPDILFSAPPQELIFTFIQSELPLSFVVFRRLQKKNSQRFMALQSTSRTRLRKRV